MSHLVRELECPICLEIFTGCAVLNCGHSFCARCIVGLIRSGRTPTCPQCRAPIREATPNYSVRSLTAAHFQEPRTQAEVDAQRELDLLLPMQTGSRSAGGRSSGPGRGWWDRFVTEAKQMFSAPFNPISLQA